MLGIITAIMVTAFSLFGYRYDHRSITHDDTPEVRFAIAAWQLPDGGVSDKPDIRVVWDERRGRNGALSLPDVDCELGAPDCTYNRVTRGCVITIDRSWYESLDAATRQAVVTHEVGHCLGLAHDDAPAHGSLMHSVMPVALVPTPYDLAKVVRLYALSRVVIGGVASD